MEEFVATTGNALSSIGHSLGSVGVAAKVLVLAHPISAAAVGGAALGMGAYVALSKALSKKTVVELEAPVAPAMAAA